MLLPDEKSQLESKLQKVMSGKVAKQLPLLQKTIVDRTGENSCH